SLEALRKDLGGTRHAWSVADVTDVAALRHAAKDLEQRVGPVDVLIANAGIGRETSADNFRAEDVEAQVRVNLIGVANSIDAVLPTMLARGRGHIVAISSLASYRGCRRWPAIAPRKPVSTVCWRASVSSCGRAASRSRRFVPVGFARRSQRI